SIDKKLIHVMQSRFIEQIRIEEKDKQVKECLNVIYEYYSHYEKDVSHALKKLIKYLIDDDVDYNLYGKIANYTFSIKSFNLFELEVNSINEIMMKNLGQAKKLPNKITLYSGIHISDASIAAEFDKYLDQMNEMISAERSKVYS